MLRSVAVSCHCFVEMFACFKVSLSESFQRRSERPTVLVPVVSSPNNNCFGIRSSEGWEERGRKGRGGAGVREGRRGGREGREGRDGREERDDCYTYSNGTTIFK